MLAPIVLAAYPVLYLLQHNQAEIDTPALWTPLLESLGVGVATLLVSVAITRSLVRGGALAAAAIVAFFYYGSIQETAAGHGVAEHVFLTAWLTVFAAAIVAILRMRSPHGVARLLATFGLVITAVSTIGIVRYASANPAANMRDSRFWTEPIPPLHTSATAKPDIYYIVTDDMPRPDVMRTYFHRDTSKFEHELERRGFDIAQRSRSPYSDSIFNMASALNLGYLDNIHKALGTDHDNVVPIKRAMEHNRAAALLEGAGYRYVHIASDDTTYAASNPDASPVGGEDSITYLWLQGSILRAVGGPIGFNDAGSQARFRASVLDAFDRLRAVPRSPGPKFVFFHTLPPHDPFIFDKHGKPTRFTEPGGSTHESAKGMQRFADQAEFIDSKVLQAIDSIVQKSDRPPIILLQSDEGFDANPGAFDDATRHDLRVKGFSAWLLPGGHPPPPDDLNFVNTYRYVFDQYFGTRLGMLDNASYLAGDAPYDFHRFQVRDGK